MKFETQKRIASELLNFGKGKIWLDPSRLEDIEKAITRQDIRELIKEKAIRLKKTKRKEKEKEKRIKGLGHTKKKVKKKKQHYVKLIRKLRRYIFWLEKNKKISREEYYKLRKLSKAGIFKNLRMLKEYLEKK